MNQALKNAILELPAEERLELAETLLTSIERDSASVLEKWYPELDLRLARYKTGEAPSYSLEVIIDKLQ